jgi:RTX calcium-binding nonapeptide repeat (4 copies)
VSGLMAAVPTPAVASTVSTNSPVPGQVWISYTAAPGERNDVSISRDNEGYLIVDPGARPLAASGDCRVLPLAPGETVSSSARCSATGVYQVVISLDDGEEDRLRIADSAYPPELPPLGAFPIEAHGGPGRDVLEGGSGPDMLVGDSGGDVIAGGAGQDSLEGDQGEDDISGGADGDVLSAGEDKDEIRGDEGDDQLLGGEGNDRLRGGDGNDRLDFGLLTGSIDDFTPGADVLDGGPGDDQINGGPPGDRERDLLTGGDGNDTADYSRRIASLDISLDGRADDGESGEQDDVQADIERVIAGSGNDSLTASAAANFLDGADGDDTLLGRGGPDILEGGVNDGGSDDLRGEGGRDVLRAGPGDDALDGGENDDVLTGAGGGDGLDGGDGDDTIEGGAGEDALDGGDGNDSLNGAAVALVGADGDDRLNAGAGTDELLGGRGNDTLDGGPNADRISGEGGKDTVTYEGRTNPVSVSLNDLPDDGEIDEHDNVRPDIEVVVGGGRGDDLSGDADVNTVDGGRGEDLVDGQLDPDQLLGGDAPDIIRARDGVADEVVDCGDGGDLAIADDRDKVIDCETVDRPGARRLVVGRYALLRPQGEFLLRLPEGRRFFPLAENLKIPIGSTIDPKAGVVRLATATTSAGARQFASVSAGRFTVRQRGGRRPVTELRLAGRLPDCPSSSNRRGRTKPAARSSPRRLLVDVGKRKRKPKGRNTYRVRGKYSIAGAPGTAWLTEDRCDGTLTTVISGTVHVRDFGRGKTVTVRPGKPYLATPS